MLVSALCLSPAALAQNRGSSNDQGSSLSRGTVIPVRVDDNIDVTRRDNRIYSGAVAQDVRADNGSMAIPRGSKVELIVRTTNNNDLTLDVDSITVNGQRFAVRANPDQIQSRDNSIVGSIMGAIDQGQLTGNEVRVPRDAVVTFRLARSLDVGVTDRGVDREGRHYHDYYDDRDQNRNNSDQYNRNNDRNNRDNDQYNRDNDRYNNRQDR